VTAAGCGGDVGHVALALRAGGQVTVAVPETELPHGVPSDSVPLTVRSVEYVPGSV